MSLSDLPLSYCTNVHPGRDLGEVLSGLDRFTVPVSERIARPLAAGLWLAAPVIDEVMRDDDGARRLADMLQDRGLCCYTLNAFPYGDFHGDRVKEQVYLPDWAAPARLSYTLACADVLAALLPEGTDGSISTVPLGFKYLSQEEDFGAKAISALIEWAEASERRFVETGRRIRLAIEPEPLCLLETTDEAMAFFEELFAAASRRGLEAVAREALGVCYDVCHQSVEYEDVADSLCRLDRAGIRINKVHITCAIRLENPSENLEGRNLLSTFAEPRYLHQVTARCRDGRVMRCADLEPGMVASPGTDWLETDSWRIHFHVPVDADDLGPLDTTRDDLRAALEAVATRLDYAPHLEVETYTWDVLPGIEPPNLVEGLSRELDATDTMLAKVSQS